MGRRGGWELIRVGENVEWSSAGGLYIIARVRDREREREWVKQRGVNIPLPGCRGISPRWNPASVLDIYLESGWGRSSRRIVASSTWRTARGSALNYYGMRDSEERLSRGFSVVHPVICKSESAHRDYSHRRMYVRIYVRALDAAGPSLKQPGIEGSRKNSPLGTWTNKKLINHWININSG